MDQKKQTTPKQNSQGLLEELDGSRQTQLAVQALIDTAPVGIALINNQAIAWADQTMHNMLGYEADLLPHTSLQTICAGPEEFDRFCDAVHAASKSSEIIHRDVRFVAKDGGIIHCYTRSRLLDLGNPSKGIILAAMNINELKGLRKKVNESKTHIRRLSSKLLQAQENERRIVAKDLHDGIGGKIAGIKYMVEKTLKEPGTPPSTRCSLEPILSLVEKTIDEIRTISKGLWPSALDDLGILRALAGLVREFRTVYSGIHIEVQPNIHEEDEIPEDLKIIIYRVVQEALNNVVKHSNASFARVLLTKTGNGIEVFVEDDGKGFHVDQCISPETEGHCYGLEAMRERVELSRGTFSIWSTKGKGTSIRAFWSV